MQNFEDTFETRKRTCIMNNLYDRTFKDSYIRFAFRFIYHLKFQY